MREKKNQKTKEKANKKDLLGKANYDTQVTRGIKIAVGVIMALGLVYLLTALATGEIKLGDKKKKESVEPEIQYEEIIAGQILNRKQNEYYVLAFDFTANEASEYLSLKDSYGQNPDALAFYIVDLEKGFNQSIVSEEEVKGTTELKVTAPTILRIKDGKIVERISTKEKVKEFLEKIA